MLGKVSRTSCEEVEKAALHRCFVKELFSKSLKILRETYVVESGFRKCLQSATIPKLDSTTVISPGIIFHNCQTNNCMAFPVFIFLSILRIHQLSQVVFDCATNLFLSLRDHSIIKQRQNKWVGFEAVLRSNMKKNKVYGVLFQLELCNVYIFH